MAVSTGVARGAALVLTCGDRSAAPRRSIQASEVERERRRFDAAVAAATSELKTLQKDVAVAVGPSQGDILGAQALVLRDPGLRDRVLLLVEEKRVNVEAALSEVIDGYTRTLDGVADSYLRERAVDVRDVGRRLLSALVERRTPDALNIPENAIIVSQELLPSVTARLPESSSSIRSRRSSASTIAWRQSCEPTRRRYARSSTVRRSPETAASWR